ncbi:MAG: hypothetical protein WA687_06770 [Solirubrobacterales bacterium]
MATAMAATSFYDHRPAEVELRETHISWAFLAGDRVYKVKKPVVFPFLDYGTPDQRRYMCEQEVRLNRRLAPDVYVGVRPIVRCDEELALGPLEGAEVVDWAVEMRRFPDDCTLDQLLAQGLLGRPELEAVARRLVRFHADVEQAPSGSARSSHLRGVINRDLETLWDLAGDLFEPRWLFAAERFFHSFMAGHRDLIEARSAGGRTRDGHGDLRLEHVVLEEGVQIVDCVEFDPGLRHVDVGDDLAFLVMDLARRGEEGLGWELVAAYREAGGDPGSDALVAHWTSYRALVRAKIAYLRAADATPDPEEQASALREGTELVGVVERFRWVARSPLALVFFGGEPDSRRRLTQAVKAASKLPLVGSEGTSALRDLGRKAAGVVGRAGGAIVAVDLLDQVGADTFCRDIEDSTGASPFFVECIDSQETGSGTMSAAQRGITHAALRVDRPVEAVVDEVEALLDLGLAARATGPTQ